MKHLKTASGIAGVLFMAGAWFLPQSAFAFTAELVSISPEPTQDISDMMGGAPDGVALFGWQDTPETEYTAVFSVDEEPAVVITVGGDMTVDSNWEYSADDSTVTVAFTAKSIVATNEQSGELEERPYTVLALVPAVELGQDGPPAEMIGSWFATNVEDWQMIPPSEGTPAFGYELTGPAGSTAYFRMFMPEGIRELLSTFMGEELSWDDMAVFSGDDQSSMSITEVTGGALVDIDVTFSSKAPGTSGGASIASTGTVTKRITVTEQEPVSISATKNSLKKGRKVTVYGWLKNGQANQTVTLWRKVKGASSFTKWQTLTTEADGYYSYQFTAKKTAKYKAKYKKNGTTKVSSTKRIVVND